MKKKRPYLITLIGWYHIVGACLLLLSLFPGLGLLVYTFPYDSGIKGLLKDILKVLNIIFLLYMSFGYLRLKLWAFWLMISFNLLSLIGWTFSYQRNKQLFFYQNLVIIIVVIIVISLTKRHFNTNKANIV